MDRYSVLRKNRRFSVDPILCHTNPNIGGMALLKNVSLLGAFFLYRQPPDVGTELKVEFIDEPLRGYQIDGKVIRHGSGPYHGFAIRFSAPHPKILRAAYHKEDLGD